MSKNKTLKEIHKFLINNDMLHQSEDYLMKKKALLSKESKEQTDSSLCESRQISLDEVGLC